MTMQEEIDARPHIEARARKAAAEAERRADREFKRMQWDAQRGQGQEAG